MQSLGCTREMKGSGIAPEHHPIMQALGQMGHLRSAP